MTVPARISMITLGVADVARSEEFYRALGWERCASSVEGVVAWFRTADTYLALFGRQDLANDARVAALADTGDGTTFRGVACATNVDTEGDVARVLAEVEAAGGRVVKASSETVFGRAGYFADPDGHLWEVAWNPAFPVRPDGRIEIP